MFSKRTNNLKKKYVELIVVWCICIIYASIIKVIYLVLLGLWLYTSLKGASIKVWNAKHSLSNYSYKRVIISIIFHWSWSFSWKKYIIENPLINCNFSDPQCSSRTLVISCYETMQRSSSSSIIQSNDERCRTFNVTSAVITASKDIDIELKKRFNAQWIQ